LSVLDRKATVSKGKDPIAIRDITDSIFATFAPTEIPPFTQESMKDRVGRAEVNYRQGTYKGIPETKVAKTVNELADKFALPDYAKVSTAMVRTARVSLMLQLPHFIAQDDPTDTKHKKNIGSSINPFMSPLEATAVTLFLLEQKTLNEDFQLSHKDFFANIRRKQVQRWQEWRAQKDGISQTVGNRQDASMSIRSNAKTEDIRQAVKKAVAGMSPDDLLNLADSSLDTLGIKR